jgi:lipocalin
MVLTVLNFKRVIYTDYDTSVIWSCNEYFKVVHLEYFWVLSRKPYINEEKLRDMLDVLTLTGIDTTYAIQTEQMGCV